jgi:hypothetical protein
MPLDLADDIVDLVDRASVGSAPITPLRSVDAAKISFGIRPFVPDRDAMLVQEFDIGIAAQEPEQFVNDRFEMQLFRGEQRETVLQWKRACAPKTEYVPVPVRSALNLPWSKTSLSRSRYCVISYSIFLSFSSDASSSRKTASIRCRSR